MINEIRKQLNKIIQLTHFPFRIVDSAPIPVCHFGRAKFHKIYRGFGASYGNCPSKKETFFEYRFHALATLEGYISDFALTPANIDDREGIWDMLDTYGNYTFLGDKGYIGKEFADSLKAEKNITIMLLKRGNSKTQFPKEVRQLIFKFRRKIETSFSQLTEQLNIETVRAKSLWGLITRLNTKVLAFNLCFYINKLIGNINLSKNKNLIFQLAQEVNLSLLVDNCEYINNTGGRDELF